LLVKFVDAFQLAERKAGGFASCIAIVRERGWKLWYEKEKQCACIKDFVKDSLRSQDVHNQTYIDVVCRHAIDHGGKRPVIVWRYCCFQETTPVNEYNSVLQRLLHARKRWYSGIKRDAKAACGILKEMRHSPGENERVLVSAPGLCIMVGIFTLQHRHAFSRGRN
jgi:hypothetical protein